VIYLFLPSFVIIYCYGCMVHTLWYSSVSSQAVDARLKSRRRLATMLIVVSSIFVITWISVFAAQIYYLYSSNALSYIVQLLIAVLVQINSCINPIVYSLHSAVFRKHMKNVCCSFFKKRQTAPSFTGIQLEEINIEYRQKVFLISYKP